jgi:hypothetical protein
VSEKEKGPGRQPEAKNENYRALDNQNPESTQGPINWQDDPRIILHDQAAVAAYFDGAGDLVIEQRDTLGSEAIIFIAPESLRLFAQAINGLAGDTGAERARRYREKKKSVTVRDAARDANVTELRLVKGST